MSAGCAVQCRARYNQNRRKCASVSIAASYFANNVYQSLSLSLSRKLFPVSWRERSGYCDVMSHYPSVAVIYIRMVQLKGCMWKS
jgi:hypothetical protein